MQLCYFFTIYNETMIDYGFMVLGGNNEALDLYETYYDSY